MPGHRKSTAWCARSPPPAAKCRPWGIRWISSRHWNSAPCPAHLSGHPPVRSGRQRGPAAHPRLRTPRAAHRHRGPAGPGRAPLCNPQWLALHHRLSHPLSRIRQSPHRHSARLDLPFSALVSRSCTRSDGANPRSQIRPRSVRLQQCRAVVARRRPRRFKVQIRIA
jgi:hypothetical protein